MIVVIQDGDCAIMATTCDEGVLSPGSVGWVIVIEVDMGLLRGSRVCAHVSEE